tara:strand:+ start:312 stop:494 length:183 start_codon:yes stop_codon:yes gene_type:complete
MKLLKEKSRTYKGTNYYKYKVNIPEKVIRAARWKDKQEVDVKVDGEKIILSKLNEPSKDD